MSIAPGQIYGKKFLDSPSAGAYSGGMKKREGYRAICWHVAEVLLTALDERANRQGRSATALLNEALRVFLGVSEDEMPARVRPGPKPKPADEPSPKPKKGKKKI